MGIEVSERLSGVLIPVFALRRKGDLKIGDTLAFVEAIEFCNRNQIDILQTLPINETSGDNSPYNAISSMALEPVLCAMEPSMVPGLEAKDVEMARQEVDTVDDVIIDYGIIKSVKLSMFEKAFNRLNSDSQFKSNKAEFDNFKQANENWLKPFTLFRALMDIEETGVDWTKWREEFLDYETACDVIERQKIDSETAEKISFKIGFYSYLQWVCDRQWREVKSCADKNNVRLMGDVPFGVSRFSADVWSNKELFDLDLSGGAPPEPVFHGDQFTKRWGQNWGIPIYNWKEHRSEDFRWWKKRISRLLDHFHDFRIDHVLGFFRVYAFPWTPDRNHEFLNLSDEEAKEKTDGVLPRFHPRDDETEDNKEQNNTEGCEILQKIADTASSGNIVAEDLGLIVPSYVRPSIHSMNMAGFAIPIFERDKKTNEFKSMNSHHPLSLITYATHDHSPIKTYYKELVERWHGPDGHEGWLEVQRLMRLIGHDDLNPPKEFTNELHFCFLKAIATSPCWMVVMMITDLLGLDIRFNQPGVEGAMCWSSRLELTLAEYESDSVYGERIGNYKKLILENLKGEKIATNAYKK